MDQKITSDIIYDLPIYREFTAGTQQTATPRILLHMILIPLLIYLVSCMSVPFIKYYFPIFTLAVFIPLFLENRKCGSKNYQRMIHNNAGRPIHHFVEFTTDSIMITNRDSGNHYTFPYKDLIRIIETKNLYIFVYKFKQANAIEKRWIRGGSKDDLISLLHNQCPNLNRNIGTTFFGKWIDRIFYAVLIVGSILSMSQFFTGCQPYKHTQSDLNLSYREIAQNLQTVDIRITEELILEMEQKDAEYGYHESAFQTVQNKTYRLLSWAGYGDIQEDTWVWVPPETGILWYDCEVFNPDSIYTDFLAAVTVLSNGELSFDDIKEDYSKASFEQGTGSVTIAFQYEGESHKRTVEYCYDWFDMDFLFYLGNIANKDDFQKDLYYSEDGQGFFLYYGTKDQVQELMKISYMPFVKAINLFQ